MWNSTSKAMRIKQIIQMKLRVPEDMKRSLDEISRDRERNGRNQLKTKEKKN